MTPTMRCLLKTLLLPALVAGAAHAATGPAETGLDEIVVTGSRAGARLADVPAALTRRDREAIDRQRAGFIGEVLNTVPGVYMPDLGNDQHAMSIRQPLSYRAMYLYLEDGIPIRPLGLFNHNALYEVNLAGADSVEVLRGPSSSLYGSNGVGGTVNFRTRPAGGTPEARLALQQAEHGHRRADLDLAATAGVHGLRVSGYSARRDGGWREHSDARRHALSVRGDTGFGGATTLKLLFSGNALDTDMPGALGAADYRHDPATSAFRFTRRTVRANRFSAELDHDWNGTDQTALTAYARHNRTGQLPDYLVFDHADDATAASGRRDLSRFDSLGTDLRHSREIDAFNSRLIAGFGVEHTDHRFVEDALQVRRDPDSGHYLDYTVGEVRRHHRIGIDSHAAYLQFESSPLPDTRAVLGLRHDRIGYDFRNRLPPGPVTGAASERRRFAHTSVRVGLSWEPAVGHSLYLNRSGGFTPPEVSALYARQAVPALEPSVYTGLELGWRARPVAWPLELEVAAFRLDGRDEVVNHVPAPGVIEPRNAGRTRHGGVELGLQWQPSAQWEASLALARSTHRHVEHVVSSTLDHSGRRMAAAPAWRGTGAAQWRPAALSGLAVQLELVHLSGYFMNDANTVRYPGHALLNLRVAHDLGAWTLWLKAQNLTDRRYAEMASSTWTGAGLRDPQAQDRYTPGAPRSLTVGAAWRWSVR